MVSAGQRRRREGQGRQGRGRRHPPQGSQQGLQQGLQQLPQQHPPQKGKKKNGNIASPPVHIVLLHFMKETAGGCGHIHRFFS
jgi:hypothetical protein